MGKGVTSLGWAYCAGSHPAPFRKWLPEDTAIPRAMGRGGVQKEEQGGRGESTETGESEDEQTRSSQPRVQLCLEQLGPVVRAKTCPLCVSARWSWGSTGVCVTSLGVRLEHKGVGLGSQGHTGAG